MTWDCNAFSLYHFFYFLDNKTSKGETKLCVFRFIVWLTDCLYTKTHTIDDFVHIPWLSNLEIFVCCCQYVCVPAYVYTVSYIFCITNVTHVYSQVIKMSKVETLVMYVQRDQRFVWLVFLFLLVFLLVYSIFFYSLNFGQNLVNKEKVFSFL